MKYVSDIISDDFSHVYYADFKDIFGFSITDEETGKTEKYNMQGTENIITKSLMLKFTKTVYGFDIIDGLWLIRPCDLALYDIIDYVREYNCYERYVTNLEEPNYRDETKTLLPNWGRYVGSNPKFTIASIIYDSDLFVGKRKAVEINNDTITVIFKPSHKAYEYKILDIKKFNILMTKYRTLIRK